MWRVFAIVLLVGPPSWAQESPQPFSNQKSVTQPSSLPISDGGSRTQAFGSYEKWLDEDVRWIITDEERTEYLKLKNDRQRDAFIVAFWERRNPEPGSTENHFKEEHYRRIAYTNSHLAAAIPGWKTDRGHIYIVYGPPDEIENNSDQAGRLQIWHYGHASASGNSLNFHFVDKCSCGDYELIQERTPALPRK